MTERVLLGEGNTARLYLWEDKALKVYGEKANPGEAEREAFKQRFAYERGLPVPQVFGTPETDGRQAVLMEYVSGPTLGDLYRADSSRLEEYVALSVEWQRRVHAIPAEGMPLLKNRVASKINEAPGLDSANKERLLFQLEGMPNGDKLCHGDYHLYNMILKEGQATDGANRLAIIDWVDSSCGDFRADVCRTYLLYRAHSVELAEMHLRLYCQSSGIEREDILQWLPVLAAAKLVEWPDEADRAYLLAAAGVC